MQLLCSIDLQPGLPVYLPTRRGDDTLWAEGGDKKKKIIFYFCSHPYDACALSFAKGGKGDQVKMMLKGDEGELGSKEEKNSFCVWVFLSATVTLEK